MPYEGMRVFIHKNKRIGIFSKREKDRAIILFFGVMA